MAPLPPLVLLLGMDCTATLFEPFVAQVGRRARCHPVAYPTDRVMDYDALEAFVRRALPGEGPFLVVAESFSGPIAIRLAADPPPGMIGVMLVATFASPPVLLPAWLARALRPLLAAGHAPRSALVRRLLGADAPPALADALVDAVHAVAPPVMAERQIAVLTVDARPLLAKIQLPMGYLQASRDKAVRARCGREIQRNKPDLWLEVVPGPHLLLQREPQACLEAIERWWADVSAAGASSRPDASP